MFWYRKGMQIGGPYPYVVAQRDMISESVLRLVVRPTSNQVVHHLPGQYAAIAFSKNEKISQARSFSIASAPSLDGTLEFGIKLSGPYTETVATLTVGTPIYVYGPFGDFIFQPRRHRNLVMIAGGIGITPFLSTIRTAARDQLPNRLVLLYSSRTLKDTPYLDEIAALAQTNPNFKPVIFLTQEPTAKPPYYAERLGSEVLRELFGNQISLYEYFLCGPRGFMDAIIEQLIDLGVPPEQIENEAFSLGPAKQLRKSYNLAAAVYGLSALSVIGISAVLAAQLNASKNTQATASITPAANAAATQQAQSFQTPTPNPAPTVDTTSTTNTATSSATPVSSSPTTSQAAAPAATPTYTQPVQTPRTRVS